MNVVLIATSCFICILIIWLFMNNNTKKPLVESNEGEWRCVSNPTSNSWVIARSSEKGNQCASKEGAQCIQFSKQSCDDALNKKGKTFWLDCQNQDFCKYDLKKQDSELYITSNDTNAFPCWSPQSVEISLGDEQKREITSVGQHQVGSTTCDFLKPTVGGMKAPETPISSTQLFNLFPRHSNVNWNDRKNNIHHFQRQIATYAPTMSNSTRVVHDWPCAFNDGQIDYLGHYDSSTNMCVATNKKQILRSKDYTFLANDSINQKISPRIELNIVDEKWAKSIMTENEWKKFIGDRWNEAYKVLYPTDIYQGPRRDALIVFLGDETPYSSNVCAQCSPINSTAVVLHLYKSCFQKPTKQELACIITHEVSHGLQWFRSRKDEMITEGIAEYVRLACGYYLPSELQNMERDKRCPDWKNYSCNGAFFHFVENRYAPLFVKDLNQIFLYESIPWTWETVEKEFVKKTGKYAIDLWNEFIQQLPENGPLYPQSWLPKARFV
jgi:hypothetical protein